MSVIDGMDLAPPLRRARISDAPGLARLMNFAGEGMTLYLWTREAQTPSAPDDPWEVGRLVLEERIRTEDVAVIDEGEGAIALLAGYPIPAAPALFPDDPPALYRPVKELERLAPGTWYVGDLAAQPAHRGRGLGGALLDLSQRIAAAHGLAETSLIVSDNNPARRLYHQKGYREIARRPIVKEKWAAPSDEWILMTRPLADG